MKFEQAIEHLTTAIVQLQGRHIANEFAIMELMSHLPDPTTAVVHWHEALANFSDSRLGEIANPTSQVSREAMNEQLAKYLAELEFFAQQQRLADG